MIAIYRRVVAAIAVDHWNSWSQSFTITLYGCNIMWPGIRRECHVSVQPPTVVCSRVQAGWGEVWGGRGGERCDQHQYLPYSFCREGLAQCWWSPAAISLQHRPYDISYQITLTDILVGEGKACLQLSVAWQKKTLIFTAQCTLVQMRGIGIACRPSVRLTVCLSVCDVGDLWSHRLESLKTNCMDN